MRAFYTSATVAAAVAVLAVLASTQVLRANDRVAENEAELPWSFAPLKKAGSIPLPEVEDPSWPQTRIDYFLLAKMEADGLDPAPAADGRTLLRRMYFDVTGLPPTMAATNGFCDCEDGIAEVIEELLSSSHYGERWGRHWLDLSRYTDVTASWLNSTGSAWLYRDWVVKSFNEDLAYPEFVKRQLAADLMPGLPPEENAALGFLGLSPAYWKELQLPPDVIKTTVADEWEERIDTVGRTFLGLTVACARCHDHKSDPISTADYYALAGVFASVRITDRPMMSEDLWTPVKAAREEVAAIEKKVAALKKKTPKPDDFDEQLAAMEKQMGTIKKTTPHYNMATVSGIDDAALHVLPKKEGHGTLLDYTDDTARDLEIQKRGNPNDVGETVPRRFLAAFPAEGAAGSPRKFEHGSGRLDLAEALIEDSQPLLARVIVNRVWRHHFGRGLVETPSDFGMMGDLPSHPELLEDLSARFVEAGWSFKWLHREILGSATWQQSSVAPASEAFDPENTAYARMNRRRLDFEAWRDTMLSVVGTLDETIGGAPGELNDDGNVRRTIYGKIHRRDLEQMLSLHDFPDPAAHSPKRTETTTPLQLLFTLNGSFVEQQSKTLAKSLIKEVQEEGERIVAAYHRLFQRDPSEREVALGEAFLEQHEDAQLAWINYAQVLLGSNEFSFVD